MQFFTAALAAISLALSTTAATSPNVARDVAARGFLDGTQVGEGTWYATGLGACGIVNTDSDYIAAVSHILFDEYPGYNGANPNDNPLCGRQIQANYQGNSVTITVTDRCTGCAETDLDFSPAAFDTLADPGVGRLYGMTWNWV